MAEKTKKSKKQIEYEQKISELTADLQRTRLILKITGKE